VDTAAARPVHPRLRRNGVSDDDRYDCEVKEGSLSMRDLRNTLNDRWKDGWALHQVFTQNGNTVIVYARAGR
jgi:hypothetical protein